MFLFQEGLRSDTKTQEYVAKWVADGHSKMEALRCLKRYISPEVYTLLRNQNRLFNSTQITTGFLDGSPWPPV